MRTLCIFSLLLGLCFFSQAQKLEWSKTLRNPSSVRPRSIEISPQGELYLLGRFRGTMDFDTGPDTFNLTTTNPNNWESFLLKEKLNGKIITAASHGEDSFHDLFIDDSNRVALVGARESVFPSPPGFRPMAKITDGNYSWQWVDQYNGTYRTVAGNKKRRFVIVGAATEINGLGGFDVITRFMRGLTPYWLGHMKTRSYEEGEDVIIDEENNSYIIGTFESSSLDLDPDTAKVFQFSNMGRKDLFIQKLDSAQNLIWARQIGGSGSHIGYTSKIRQDELGNLYVVSSFSGNIDLDPDTTKAMFTSNGDYDLFIAKLNPEGKYIWGKQIGGPDRDLPFSMEISNNAIYLGGYFEDSVDFDPDTSKSYQLKSKGGEDGFVMKLDTSGNFIWAHVLGNTGQERIVDLALDGLGGLYITGNHSLNVDVDPSSAVQNVKGFNGFNQTFVVKWNTCGDVQLQQADTACNQFISPTGKVWDSSGVYSDTLNCDTVIQYTINIDTVDLGIVRSGDTLFALQSGVAYQWINCDSNSFDLADTLAYFIPPCSGTYSVMLTNNTCQLNSNCFDYTGARITRLDTACKAFISPTGKVWRASGIYTDTLDCDTVISFQITIDSADLSIVQQQDTLFAQEKGASYRWFNCDSNLVLPADTLDYFIPPCIGNYSVEIDRVASCIDTSTCFSYSGMLLHRSVEACQQFISPTGKVWNTAGNYADTLNCDTIIDFELAIRPLDLSILRSKDTLFAMDSAASYQWINCDSNSIILGDSLSYFIPPVSGNYAVEIARADCRDTSSCFSFVITGLNQLSDDNHAILIFPNPSRNSFSIRSSKLIQVLRIRSVSGQVVWEEGVNRKEILIKTNLDNGLYFLEMELSNQIVVYRKLMIQN